MGIKMNTRRTTLTALALLMMTALSAAAGEFPEDWYWDRPEEHAKFEGRDAPALTVGQWVGAEFDLNQMKGNIVVIDFWATWCGPCIALMPKNNKIAEKYAKDGVKLIGVCTSTDAAEMSKVVQDNKAKYPNAFVDGDQVEKDWPLQWYPTYAVVDREGVVRAIGLKPDRVEDVIQTLLADEAEASGVVRIRPNWLEGSDEKRKRLKPLEDKSNRPPELTVDGWRNSDPLKLKDLKGKVVVLDFWATWSPSNEKTIPKHNALIQQYGKEGLVIIGICATLGKEFIEDAIESYGIAYPVCTDIENNTNTAYAPDGYSDYYIIDRAGKLRVADCANKSLEDVVKALLGEKQAEKEPEAAQAEGDV